MAFKKSIEVKNSGVSAEYWKISSMYMNGNEAHVTFELYKDQASRDAGKGLIDTFNLVLDQVDSDKIISNIYKSIKKEGVLVGAEDV